MNRCAANISLIHQLSRTGGTLFSRVLGNSSNVLLLSEVHPSRRGRDIKKQCLNRYKIAIPNNLDSYLDCLKFLSTTQTKDIVIRDFSHADFLNKKSQLRILSSEILEEEFHLRRISLARHPADQYLSMMNFKPIKRYMNFEIFCRGYLSYHEAIPSRGIIRYEDFVRSPERILSETSRFLKIDLSKGALNNFHKNKNVSGDRTEDGSRGFSLRQVKELPKRDGFDDICKQLRRNKKILEICERLHYEI